MSRQYSVDDIAKYKAGSGLMSWWDNYNHRLNEFSNAIGMGQNYEGSGYSDWIANLMSIKEGGRMAPEYYIDGVPQYYNDVEEDYVEDLEGGGKNIILSNYKMPRPKKIRGGDIDPNARFPYIDNIYPPPPNPNLNVLVPWIDNDDQQIGNPPPPPPPLIPIPALQMPPTREEMRERRRVLRGGANAMHHEMFGTGMSSDEMDMEGEGVSEWMRNLSKLFKLLKIRATM